LISEKQKSSIAGLRGGGFNVEGVPLAGGGVDVPVPNIRRSGEPIAIPQANAGETTQMHGATYEKVAGGWRKVKGPTNAKK
jgi:hypothetical protein